MRRLTKVLVAVAAGVLLVLPGAVLAAPPTATDYMQMESNHSDYGATEWHTNVLTAGNPGDQSWGYTTGVNPMVQGLADADGTMPMDTAPLPAPAYTDPCNAEILGGTYNLADGASVCGAISNAVDPQTAPMENGLHATVVDDLLAKMYETSDPQNTLTQQLDILFVNNASRFDQSLLPAPLDGSAPNPDAARLLIDQTLDQDLVFYEGDISSFMTDGMGIKNRLTQVFELDNSTGQNSTTCSTNGSNVSCGVDTGNVGGMMGPHAEDADHIDQWLISYTKGFGGMMTPGAGIVSSYTSWFEIGTTPSCGMDCQHDYQMGHDPIAKTAAEIDNHP